MRKVSEHLEEPLFEQKGDGTYNWHFDNATASRLRIVLQTVCPESEHRTSNGVFMMLHTLLVTLQNQHCIKHNAWLDASELYYTLKGLLPLFPHESKLLDDQEGNTVLHYNMKFARNRLLIHKNNSPYGRWRSGWHRKKRRLGEVEETRFWNAAVRLVVRNQQGRRNGDPTSCDPLMVVNKRGQTPLCVALTKGLPNVVPLANLPTDAVTETMYQGLYPFQLAATATNDPTIVGGPCCIEVAEQITEKEVSALTNTYTLLRLAPHLASSAAITEEATSTACCPIYKQIVLNELQVARFNRQNYEKTRKLEESTQELCRQRTKRKLEDV